jgi:hypothetical protein
LPSSYQTVAVRGSQVRQRLTLRSKSRKYRPTVVRSGWRCNRSPEGDSGELTSGGGEVSEESARNVDGACVCRLRYGVGVGSLASVRNGIWLGVLSAVHLCACSGSPEIAQKNRTFYDWATAVSSTGEFEEAYPPLDLSAAAPRVRYKGVTVLRRGIHLSRPNDWVLRDGSSTPGQAFVQYISPNAYAFAIHERPESVQELWRDVMRRFEDDTRALGAKIVGAAVPIATQIGQGRAYTIEREVEAPKKPLTSRSREYLLRGQSRIVLVQIVHEGEDLSAADQELLRVINTLEVL